MRKNLSLILILGLSCLLFMGLKLEIDKVSRQKIPGSSIIYIPSGNYLKMATFGFSSLMADIVYIWAIQYFGNAAIPDKFDHFVHIFSIISELDPRYIDPYEVGAMIALYDTKDIALSIKLLDMGFAKNPDLWIFPLEAGHYAQLYKKDFPLAREYYKKAMDIPGAPDIAKRLYANAAFKVMDIKTAWETWLEVYETAKEERVKKIASNHIYNIKATVDIRGLRSVLEKYRAKYGRYPDKLSGIVAAGLLPFIPRDYDNKDYAYDPKTGDVKTAVIPWKR
jgi:tetratricopeptide (TPR) repeat protein